MTERGQGDERIIAKTGETDKSSEHDKKTFKMRVSCFDCEIFEKMRPLEKIHMFRFYFALLHKDHDASYAKYIDSIEVLIRGAGEECKEKSLVEEYREELGLGWCCKWRDVIGECFKEVGEPQIIEAYKMLDSYCDIVGKRAGKLHAIQEKLRNLGAYNRLELSGVGERPYFCENFAHLLTDEEAKLLFHFDYKMKRGDKRYYYLDTVVNLELPLSELVVSFKKIVKEKQAVLYKGLCKADGKPNVPDFKVWQYYLLAYTLKEKGVKASLLNPTWPNKKLSRKEVADLLFSEEDRLPKLDRYIREAKKLIKQAKACNGQFSIYKLEVSPYIP